MFIHNYYTIIIMIAFSLLAATTIYYLLMQILSVRIKWILILLFLVLIFPRAYEANTNRLGQKQDISEAIQFIMEHTDENDLILNESVLSPITIYTGRGLIFPRVLRNRTIREDIHKIGFAETMKKYRIKYLFTPNEKPLYIDFAPIFTETSIREPRFDRKHYIYNEIGERNPDMERGYQELEDIVKRYRIDEKFKEEAKTGKFRFYSFVN
jgi:energy-coupling factor transporter transmembrane protein EcfT